MIENAKTNRGHIKASHRHSFYRRASALAVVPLITCIALAMVSAGKSKTASGGKETAPNTGKVTLPAPATVAAPDQARYLRRGYLTPEVRAILGVQGDRFERPGKERLILTGTLTRPNEGDKQPHAFRIVSEFPASLRFEEQVGAQLQITVFNQGKASKLGGPLAGSDQDTLETLVFDSIDHFFGAQVNRSAMRHLGSRFRLDGGSDEDYAGPVYELYQVIDEVQIGTDVRQQPKLFYFNSHTLLLERVSYELKRNGEPLNVEVQLGNWVSVSGQQLPGVITRSENGEPVLTLSISATAVTARVADGSFDKP